MSGGGGGRGGGRSGGGGGGQGIPAAARKMVANLKEIVNCPELEIYGMLKECGMDPSEAVHRLLTQDTFHEVKSKREKKKEVRESTDNRSRSVSASSNRGGRGGTDRGGRNNTPHFSPNDSGAPRGKSTHKKENPENIALTSILGSGASAGYPNRRSTLLHEAASVENAAQATSVADGVPFPAKTSSGFQNSWFGAPGRLSMADVVKMGRPQVKPPSLPVVASDTSFSLSDMPPLVRSSASVLPSESNKEMNSSHNSVLKVTERTHEQGIDVGQHHNDWVLVDEMPAGSIMSAPDTASTDLYVETSILADETNLHAKPHLDEFQEFEDDVVDEDLQAEPIRSLSASNGQVQLDLSQDNTHLADNSVNNMSSFESHVFEHHKVDDVNDDISSVAANLNQLSLQKEDQGASSAEEIPAVIIPDHLQVTNIDCSHLSFGSFGSGISAAFSGSFSSKPLKTNLDAAPAADDNHVTAACDQSDARIPEYYDNGQHGATVNENVASTTGTTTREFDMPSASETEIMGSASFDATHGLQYNFPSASGYTLSSTPEGTYNYPQSNSQMQNLAPFASLMQPYSNALPSNSLASTLQPVRNFDLPFSSLLTTQSVPTKYGTSVSSISGPTSSMPEAVKPGVLSPPHPSQQSLPSTSIPTGHALPQHLPVHPYSQPTLPLGHFANMISYQFPPQSYAYVPSAFQQTYAANGSFHQSPTSIHNAGVKYTLPPQYKSSVSVTSLPQSASVASGYGGFGSSMNIPGGLTLNSSAATASTSIGFAEALSSQYKEGNHHLPQQSENPALWAQGPSLRTMSAMPASTFYSFLGQNQLGGYRQGQQPSHFGSVNYPNFYHSQAGVSPEHQQNPTEGSLNNNSQAAQSQQSHQIWQHSY